MTITYISANNIQGLSSDTKPNKIPKYSTFYETDSMKSYLFDVGEWIEQHKRPAHSNFYQMGSPLSTVQGQHFVYHFNGSSLDTNIWTLQNHSGTGSAVINDIGLAGDRWGGIQLSTGASGSANSSIDFNDKRQYQYNACEIIFVARRYDSSTRASWGLTNTSARTLNFADSVDDSSNTNKSLRTADGSTISETESSTAVSATPMDTMKLVLGASNVVSSLNGVEEVAKTTNIPVAKLQPSFDSLTLDGSANGSLTRYVEAYNT